NAVEGCVRETFGALLAGFQATRARDPGIARLMRSIARDEMRHAALSWAVARWASPRLDAGARARLDQASREAVESLRRRPASLGGDDLAGAGVPDATEWRALVAALEEQLWSRWATHQS